MNTTEIMRTDEMMKPEKMNKAEAAEKAKKINVRVVAFVGMLGALSTVLQMFEVSLPFAPSFMKFDISELPALLAGFLLGPADGCLVVIVKNLLKLLMRGTNTAFVGELSNVAGSCIYVLCAAMIYMRNKTKKTAVKALIISTLSVSIVQIFMNAWVMFPLYSRLYGLSMDVIIGMGSKVNPLIKDNLTMMIFGVFPFNLFKHGVTSLVTFLLYKRISAPLKDAMRI